MCTQLVFIGSMGWLDPGETQSLTGRCCSQASSPASTPSAYRAVSLALVSVHRLLVLCTEGCGVLQGAGVCRRCCNQALTGCVWLVQHAVGAAWGFGAACGWCSMRLVFPGLPKSGAVPSHTHTHVEHSCLCAQARKHAHGAQPVRRRIHTHPHPHSSPACRADDSEWRREFYHSEYTKTNAEVHPPRSMTDEAKEHAFYKWMARQQLYYKDLLKVCCASVGASTVHHHLLAYLPASSPACPTSV